MKIYLIIGDLYRFFEINFFEDILGVPPPGGNDAKFINESNAKKSKSNG